MIRAGLPEDREAEGLRGFLRTKDDGRRAKATALLRTLGMDISRRRNDRIARANPAYKAEISLSCPRLQAAAPSGEVYRIVGGAVKGIH